MRTSKKKSNSRNHVLSGGMMIHSHDLLRKFNTSVGLKNAKNPFDIFTNLLPQRRKERLQTRLQLQDH